VLMIYNAIGAYIAWKAYKCLKQAFTNQNGSNGGGYQVLGG
jgi:hypothetical protein